MEGTRRWGCASSTPALLMLALAMTPSTLAARAEDETAGAPRERPLGGMTSAPPVRGADRALRYFADTRGRSLDSYVRSLRPPGISAEAKARALAMVRPQDIVSPSPARQAKLDAVRPVLEYLERGSTTEVKILRLGLAWAAFLQGAAVLLSEEAVDLLSVEELQAVVAHELAHEYFADEYRDARANQQYETVKEIELRCDAVAILTMTRLGREPGALLSAAARLRRYNERHGHPDNRDLEPGLEERKLFARAMVALVRQSGEAYSRLDSGRR